MHSSSIRTHLIVLVLAMAVPLCTLVGIGIYIDMQQTILSTKASLRILANSMARNTGNKIAAAHHALDVLAARPSVKAMDPNRCDPGLADFLTMNPSYANVGYADLDGRVVCSVAPLPKPKGINSSETPWFKAFIQSKDFVVGLPQKGLITGKWVSVIAAPVRNDNQEVIGAIFLPLDLKNYDPLIPDEGLPHDSRYGFFATDGTMVWRNSDPEGLIGTKPASESVRRLVELKNGEFEGLGVDGIRRYFSIVAMPGAKWIAFVGVPVSAVYAEAKRRALMESVIVAVILALLGFLASSISRRISKPVVQLEDVARRLHDGELDARAQTEGPREIAAVATQFNQLIEAQQNNMEELRIAAVAFESQQGMMVTDANGVVLRVNKACTEITGYSAEEVCGKTPRIFRSGIHDKDFFVAMWAEIKVTGGWHGEIWDKKKNGEIFPQWLSISSVRDSQGKVTHYIGSHYDITQRKKHEEEMFEKEERLALATINNQVGIWDWNLVTQELIWDDSMYTLYHMRRSDFAGTIDAWRSAFHPDDLDRVVAAAHAAIAGERDFNIEYRVVRPSGEIRYIRALAKVFCDAENRPVRMLGTNTDVTDRKEMESQVEHMAFYDALTHLPNRRLLNDRLLQAIAGSQRSANFGAVIFIDLDNFKPLNDQYGHAVGDLLLVEVAQRLTQCVRQIDTVARFGGDEFVIILSELAASREDSTQIAIEIAEKMRSQLATPYQIKLNCSVNGNCIVEHHCTSSIGLVLFDGHDHSTDDIIKWADTAMYQAKDAGRNCYRFFDTPS